MARRAGRQIAAEQYFESAMTILGRDGAAGLKIGPLCRSLGVTSGSFYHHFGGWAGFVRGLLQYWESQQTDRVVELARATADPIERVLVVRRLTVELRHDAEAAIRAWAQIDPEVGRAQARVDGQRRIALEQVVGDVVESTEIAHRLAIFGYSLLVGFQQTCDPRDRDLLQRLLGDYQDLILAHAAPHLRPVTPPIR
ncbi:TetR/AcrR family transcriptional regulator [Pseudonocardia parietis]|uniref:AcrR family transcriptional regulator n=1 Tax=Pseudonocardia parietis TaxID=570936 RepID=A0ABS4VPA8_9PSEU|nr:TetR/AcrR family transcriptional regulator [Pseudonocardia parietis]MBP2365761.1 AcrR family transcriptional regulator [Pseudonocardia parietis]